MKISSSSLSILAAIAFATACNSSNTDQNAADSALENTVASEAEAAAEATEAETLDVDALVSSINERKETIEKSIGQGESISTENLRAKLRQKWSKIDYYTDELGAVIRIKTYPHEGISQRTEEFYFDGVELVLAVIEDNGSAPRSEEGEADKMYYFHNWEPIKEVRTNNEDENGYKESDAEELLAEAREYLRIYTERKG